MEFLLSKVEIITIELWKCRSLKIDDERVGRVGIRWGRWDNKNKVSFVFLSQQAFLRLFSLHFKQTSFVWAHVKNAQASSKNFSSFQSNNTQTHFFSIIFYPPYSTSNHIYPHSRKTRTQLVFLGPLTSIFTMLVSKNILVGFWVRLRPGHHRSNATDSIILISSFFSSLFMTSWQHNINPCFQKGETGRQNPKTLDLVPSWIFVMSLKTTTTMRELVPDDVVEDILGHLPVKSLTRFRCVLKSRDSIITKPTFITKHFKLNLKQSESLISTNTHSGYLLYTTKDKNSSSSSKQLCTAVCNNGHTSSPLFLTNAK